MKDANTGSSVVMVHLTSNVQRKLQMPCHESKFLTN